MRRVRTALVGLGAQTLLLALVSVTVGISARGWVFGLAACLAAHVWLALALHRAGSVAVGPANLVTLGRVTIVATVAALVTGTSGHDAVAATLTLAAIALALDAVDGQVARRTQSVSTVGARFDGEVDAFLILVLSVAVAPIVGPWVLAIGLWRYAFGFAGVCLRWLRQPLPTSYWGKTVAVVQGVTLTVALSRLLPHDVTVSALVIALLLLTESFCQAIWWLWAQRPAPTAASDPRRRVVRGVATGVGAVVVWAALVVPDRPNNLAWSTFLRIPIEGVVLVAVALVVPARARRFLALMGGLALAALLVARSLDIGFFSVLDRPFNPVTDWASLGPALGVLIDSIGRTPAILIAVGAGAVMLALVVAITVATVQVTRVAVRHRHLAAQTVIALGAAWTLLAVGGVTTGGGAPAAARSTAVKRSPRGRSPLSCGRAT